MSTSFLCPRHDGGLILSPGACASMWRRGTKAPAWAVIARCQGCEIGAAHAGEPLPPKVPPVTLCCRCGATGRRIVRGQVCISCYNRELEVRRGRDRRGNIPLTAPRLHVLSLLLGTGRPFSAPVAGRLELAILAARTSPGSIIARNLPVAPGIQDTLFPGLPSHNAGRGGRPKRSCAPSAIPLPMPIPRVPIALPHGSILYRPLPLWGGAAQEVFAFRGGL